jgi:hypothetical protein
MTRGINHHQKGNKVLFSRSFNFFFSFSVRTSNFSVYVKNLKKQSESSSSSVPQAPVKVWQPGVDKLEEDEELQCDPSAYNSLHGFHIGWPCLR